MSGAAVELRGVGVRAGGRQILQELDLVLRPGELTGLIGPSGAGKSTLIRVLLGLQQPSEGTVSHGVSGPLGYVPQDDVVHRALTVRQALGFAAELRLSGLAEEARTARIEEVAGQVGLGERLDVRVRKLSGGQRKRVSVALELLLAPPLLVLDEPTSGLDPGLEAQLMGLFADLAAGGRAVLVATHAMRSLRRCQQLVILVAGRLAYAGPPEAAVAYFEAPDLPGIFEVIAARAPVVWARQWQQSALRRRALAPSPSASAREVLAALKAGREA